MSPRTICLASLCLLAATTSCLILNVTAQVSVSTQLACGIWTDASGTAMNYDFSTLTSDYSGLDTNPGSAWVYWLHICGSLTSAPAGCLATQNLAACQTETGANNAIGVFSSSTPPTFEYAAVGSAGFPKGGVTYQMKSPAAADCAGGSVGCCYQHGVGWGPYTTTVNLLCSPTQDAKVSVNSVGCSDTYTFNTPLACGVAASGPSSGPSSGGDDGGGKKGLSGGWIFIIILVCVIPVYIGVGCFYKHQKLGSVGIEKCPNIEFWREIPALVKDGCAFTWMKLRGLCGGNSGGGGGSQSYETMFSPGSRNAWWR